MLELAPTRLFDGDEVREGASVVIDGGSIVAVRANASAAAKKLDGLLAPGFLDVQVNGGGGAMFNDAPNAQTLATIAAAHRSFGVTGVMATLISDDRRKLGEAFAAIEAALAAGVEGIIGLHLEGPWLSTPRKGVHPAAYLRPFDEEDLRLLIRPRTFPLMVTVAPEGIDLASLRALKNAGVIVCLGHTAAAAEDVDAALAAGARGFTHLFNAMSQLEGRKPGAVGAALAHTESWAGLILDGVHVHPTSARVAFACKSARRLMLVSDAMSTVGSDKPSMSLFGETISVRNGALRTAEGVLAGAHLELSTAARNAVALLGASEAEALRMVTLTPAEFLGVSDRGRIAPGARADFVLLDETLNATRVWAGGKQTR